MGHGVTRADCRAVN